MGGGKIPEISALSVRLDYDDSAVQAGAARTNQTVSGLGGTLASAFGGAAIAGVAALGAGMVGAAKSAMDFEKQMSAVSAVSGASQSELASLSQYALQLGKDTSFSAQEAAVGIEELVKAGVSIGDVMGGAARASLDLAAAGAVSVGDAAEIASNAMNVFGLKGADMAHVADVIAGAANASAIGVNDYKFSLAEAGAVAATVGISFESLSQAIAVMGNAGIKGSSAGTSLKTMLLNLQPSTNKQIDLFRELGITTTDNEAGYQNLVARGLTPTGKSYQELSQAIKTHLGLSADISKWSKDDVKAFNAMELSTGLMSNAFFDAGGKAKDMAGIAEVLKEKLGGMTKAAQLSTLEIMFGSDAIRAGAVLLGAGAAGFEKMAEAMGKVTAQQVAEERLNNLAGSLEKLKGSLETGAIILGGMFTPALKDMADAATEHVNAAIDVLEQIPDVIETVRQVLAGEWAPDASIRPFTNAVGEAAIVFRDDFLPSIMAASDFATGTLVPAFMAVTGFLADHLEIVAGVTAAWATFTIITTVAGWITAAIAAWGAMSGAITAAGGVIAALVAVLGGPLTIAIVAVAAIVGVLTAAWIGNWGGIQEKTAAVVAWLGTAMTEAGVWLTWLGEQAVLLWQAMVATWDAIVAAVTTAWDGTVAVFTAGMAAVTGLWDAGWAMVAETATAAWNLLSTENQDRILALVALMAELWRLLPALWAAGTALISTTLSAWWTAASTMWTTQTTALTTTTTTGWTAITTAWTTGTAAVTAVVGPWWVATQELWAAALKIIQDALGAAWAAIVEATAGLFTRLSEAWTSATTALRTLAGQLGAAIMDALLAALNEKVAAVVDTVIGGVRRALEGAKGLLGSWGGGSFAPAGGVSQRGSFDDQAVAAARRAGIPDPERFAAQMRQESGDYDPDVINGTRLSSTGAQGVAQFMPGTRAAYPHDPTDPSASIEAGAKYMADLIQQYGSQKEAESRYYGAPSASSMDGRHYSSSIDAKRGNVRVSGGPNGRMGDVSASLNVDQTAWASGMDGAAAICGPYAASIFADYVGRPPTAREAAALAGQFGWTPGQGMTQSDQVDDMANAFIQQANPGSAQRVTELRTGDAGVAQRTGAAAIGAGAPVGFNTSAHYFMADDFNAATGAFHVGATGTTMRGGSEWMTVAQIAEVGNGLLGVLTVSGQTGAGFGQLGEDAQTGFGQVAQGGLTAGAALVSVSTDSLDNVTRIYSDATGAIGATVTNAAGQIVNAWGSMAQAALTSVTNLGDGLMTTMTDSAGSTITTVTDMQGQVTSQYATLANGVSLTMGDLAAGVMTSTTDLGTGIMTTVQDTAGNYITTVTDLAGNVTDQYTQLASDVVAQTTEQNTQVVANNAATGAKLIDDTTNMAGVTVERYKEMNGDIVTIVTDQNGKVLSDFTTAAAQVGIVTDGLGTKLISSAGNTMGGVTEVYREKNGEIVTIVTDSSGKVVQQFNSVSRSAEGTVEPIEAYKGAISNMPTPNMSGVVRQFGDVASAAKKAESSVAKYIGTLNDLPNGKFGGSLESRLKGRATGGSVDIGETYLIGERGPELFTAGASGYVTNNHRLSMLDNGDGGSTDTLVLNIQVDGRTAEKIYITGKQLAARRGRD